MVTVGNKIETFTQIVMDKLNADFEAKKQVLEAQNESALKAYESVAKDKAQKYILDFEAEGRRDAKMLISHARTSVRNKHIETRQEIYKALEKNVKEAVLAFTQTQGYSAFLKSSVTEAASEIYKYEGIDVELSKADYENKLSEVQGLLEANNVPLSKVTFHPIEKGMLGGVIFYNESHIVRMDYSLDAILEENSRILGMLLSELLDEVGE